MKETVLLLLLLFNALTPINAQTSWIGGSGDWADAVNWDAGVPSASVDAIINGTVTVTISSGTAAAKSLVISGMATLNVQAGTNLNVSTATNQAQSNAITINGSGSTLNNHGTITCDSYATAIGHVGIQAELGGTFNNFNLVNCSNTTGSTLGYAVVAESNGTVDNDGTINASSLRRGIAVLSTLPIAGSKFINDNIVNITSSSSIGVLVTHQPTNSLTNNGTINLIDFSGSADGIVLGSGADFENNDKVIFSNFTSSGELLSGNSLAFSNNSGGSFQGAGTILADLFVSNGGKLIPGESPGTLTFDGSETFDGEIDFEIDGTSGAGVAGGHDQITLTSGTATVVATLNIAFGGSYSPTDGDMFQIINAPTMAGSPTPSFSGLASGFSAVYDNPTGTVTVSAALPVELTSFTATMLDEQVQLKWQTEGELQNKGFELQRSLDGSIWQKISFIPGHGTTHEQQSYTYTDERPLVGMNYYRLQQVDFDGQFEYSKVTSVEVGGEDGGIRLFPNPTSGSFTLALESDYAGEANLNLYDHMGRLVKEEPLVLEGAVFRTDIGLDGLPTGVYLARIQAGREQWQERLMVK